MSESALRDASAAFPTLDGLRAVVARELAPITHEIDHGGVYPAQAMRALGDAGLYGHHLKATAARPSIGAAIDAMSAVSETCMSAGFCTWCQDASGWYLEQSDNSALRESLQPGLASGAQMGGTGGVRP